VLYCGSGNGRIHSGVVAHILKTFLTRNTPVFYVITNLFSHSEETLNGQIEGAMKIMSFVTKDTLKQLSSNFGK
jgi:hypothetical protein